MSAANAPSNALFLFALDTDSILLACYSDNLESCLKPEFARQWPQIQNFLFEDVSSEREQSGLLKVMMEEARARYDFLTYTVCA